MHFQELISWFIIADNEILFSASKRQLYLINILLIGIWLVYLDIILIKWFSSPYFVFFQYNLKNKIAWNLVSNRAKTCLKKLSMEKTDPVWHRFYICTFYKFPQKSCNVCCFMHNKINFKSCLRFFLDFSAYELHNRLIQDTCGCGLSGSICYHYYSISSVRSIALR